MMAKQRVTITHGCTSQNFRVFTSVASKGRGRAIRPSICMKAGGGAFSVCLTDGFGCFKTSPSDRLVCLPQAMRTTAVKGCRAVQRDEQSQASRSLLRSHESELKQLYLVAALPAALRQQQFHLQVPGRDGVKLECLDGVFISLAFSVESRPIDRNAPVGESSPTRSSKSFRLL